MTRSLDEPSSSYSLIAKSYKLAEDRLSALYFIDEEALFNNGKKVTAFDVKYSFDLLISDDAHPQYRIYWADVESVIVLNDLTVQFIFKRET